MVVRGMYGLGDNIYQRAFVREIKEPVYLRTSWPQLYSDLPWVKPVKPTTRLRTQNKNVARQDASIWHRQPSLLIRHIRYGNAAFKKGSLLDAMRKCLGVRPAVFDLPHFEGPGIAKPYAVVRPVTVRSEWYNIARNPLPEYICEAAEVLHEAGLTVVSVADLQDGAEWAEMLPDCDIDYTHGELLFEQLMGLIRGAAIVVGGVGWIVPAAVAAGVPLAVVLGGHGAHNAPEKITGPPMDLSKTRWLYPDNFCRCSDMMHRCDKLITGFTDKFRGAVAELCSIPLSQTA